jgi:tRNA(fMet)-specific endonuclease VapC
MKYVLDTDHISIWERPGSREYPILLANMNKHDDADIGVCVVSYQEQTLGINASINRSKTRIELLRAFTSLYRIIDTFRSFPLLAFDEAALTIYENLKQQKIRIGTPDLRIASIALANDLTLVSRNNSDFSKVPGLKIEDWTK